MKVNKIYLCVIAFAMMFLINMKVFAVDNFPDKIKSSVPGAVSDPVSGTYPIYKIEYSSTNPTKSGKAFCTSFMKDVPKNISCNKTGWSSKPDISEKVSAAVGSLIAKARPASGAMSWDNFFYSEMAINKFLYNGYTNKKGYGVTYNSLPYLPSTVSNNATFKSLLATAEYEYNNYKNTKIAITSTKYDQNSRTATAVVTCSDYQGKKIACNISDKSVSATLDGNNITGINLTATQNSDKMSYTLKAVLPEYGAGTIKIQFSATDKHCWNTAQNYNCGDSYQSLTPNLLKPVCHNKSAKSPVITNSSFHLEVHKVDETGQLLDGATALVTKDGNPYSSENNGYVTLIDGKIDFYDVEAGEYCISEVKSPAGYKISNERKCVTVNAENPNPDPIVMVNEKSNQNLTVNKVDEDGNPVVGAKLKIFYVNTISGENEQSTSSSDDDSAVVDVTKYDITTVAEWVTDGNPKVIEGLELGKTYTVVEEEMPEGYAGGITSVDITISEDSSKNIVTLRNTKSKITVSKQSITSSKELPGAKLTITNAQGTVVASWTSTDKPQEITGLSDGDYTLTETTAPQGYTVAESISFTIEGGKLKDDADNTLVMKDATIVEVPDTFNIQNIIAMIAGVVLVGLGTGVLFYETKKKKA